MGYTLLLPAQALHLLRFLSIFDAPASIFSIQPSPPQLTRLFFIKPSSDHVTLILKNTRWLPSIYTSTMGLSPRSRARLHSSGEQGHGHHDHLILVVQAVSTYLIPSRSWEVLVTEWVILVFTHFLLHTALPPHPLWFHHSLAAPWTQLGLSSTTLLTWILNLQGHFHPFSVHWYPYFKSSSSVKFWDWNRFISD